MTTAAPSHVTEDQSEIFAFLADPATYGLKAPVRRIDTHGAAVFLAGRDAYKVKRAVRFPFMDFSTRARREAACKAEIAVNRAFAPQLYLGAVPIIRDAAGLRLGGRGEAVEWAVHMRRFDETQTLDLLAEAGALPGDLAAKLAPVVLGAHTKAAVCIAKGGADRFIRCAEENRDGLAEFPELFAPQRMMRRYERIRQRIGELGPLLDRRAQTGFVRRCHGDMHLRNIALIDGAPVLFDAIDFYDEIAISDILYDLAFLLMDLWERGLEPVANELFCRYLWYGEAQNIEALSALPLMLSMRAAIRAKVSAASLAALAPEDQAPMRQAAQLYFETAGGFLTRPAPRLIAIGGLSGTGKSALAGRLAARIGPAPGALVLRSDIERKILAGAGETEKLGPGEYSPARTEAVYGALRRKARAALMSGWPVIVDAVHAKPRERAALTAIAAKLDIPFDGLWLETPLPARRARVAARRGDASDADAAIAEQQEAYETGEIDWRRIDAGGSLEQSLEAALGNLGAAP